MKIFDPDLGRGSLWKASDPSHLHPTGMILIRWLSPKAQGSQQEAKVEASQASWEKKQYVQPDRCWNTCIPFGWWKVVDGSWNTTIYKVFTHPQRWFSGIFRTMNSMYDCWQFHLIFLVFISTVSTLTFAELLPKSTRLENRTSTYSNLLHEEVTYFSVCKAYTGICQN